MTQKPEVSEDLRVRRSRKLLQQAFIELTVEKGFAELTVRDITERAMVNRSTFYRHYLDKYDLLEQYMNEIYELSEDQTDVGEKREAPFDEGSEETLRLLKHIQAFADFYRAMFRAKADPYFLQLFRKKTEKLFLSCIAQTYPRLLPEPDAPPSDLKLNVIAYAGVGAIVWWLEQEQPRPPEHLAIWLDQLIGVIAGLALKPNG
jgi:AcrR family transcriptional regulator